MALNLFGYNSRESKSEIVDDYSLTKSLIPRLITVESEQDFIDFLEEDDRLAIVKFHASWCKACQKFGVLFRKLAFKNGDKMNSNNRVVESGRVRFAEVEFMNNAKLCRKLGIKRLPGVQIYKGNKLLSEFSCAPKKFQRVIDSLNEFVDMPLEEVTLKDTLEAGSAMLDNITVDLKRKSKTYNISKNTTQINV